MNKTDLVAAVAAATDLTKKDTAAVIDAALDVISRALANGDCVRLSGFGTFELHERAAREALNPQTKERVSIQPHKSPAFRPAQSLKEIVNK